MRWAVVFIMLCCAEWPTPVAAQVALRSDDIPLDPSVLWLPAKYQRLEAKLYRAAGVALEQPRCIEVRSGTVDLRQSSAGVPVFRILCEEATGLTYTEMVTSEGYKTLTPKKNALQACFDLLAEKTELMQELKWVPSRPVASYPSEQVARRAAAKGIADIKQDADGNRLERYQWDFDAAAATGESLHYRAVCTAVNGQNAVVDVKARSQ